MQRSIPTRRQYLHKGGTALASMGVLAACGPLGQTQPQTTTKTPAQLRFVTWFTSQDPIHGYVERFSREHPHIRMTSESTAGGSIPDLLQKITAEAAGGTHPEVTTFKGRFAADFVKIGTVVPMDDFIKGWNQRERDDWHKLSWELNRYKGKVWALPHALITTGVYYNKELLDRAGVRPPRTWDEWVPVAKRTTTGTETEASAAVWGYVVPHTWDAGWQAQLWAGGGELFSKDLDKVLIDSAESVAALQSWLDLTYGHKASPPPGTTVRGFDAGGQAMIWTGSWTLPQWRRALGDKVGLFEQPVKRSGGSGRVAYDESVAIYKASAEKQKAAWEFVQWLTSAPVMAQWNVDSGRLPARQSARQQAVYQTYLKDPVAAELDRILVNATRWNPAVDEYNRVNQEIMKGVAAAMKQEAPPKTALEDAARLANRIIAETRGRG